MTPNFDVFFDLRHNKRLSKRSWAWWFETLSRTLWRRYNAVADVPECSQRLAEVEYWKCERSSVSHTQIVAKTGFQWALIRTISIIITPSKCVHIWCFDLCVRYYANTLVPSENHVHILICLYTFMLHIKDQVSWGTNFWEFHRIICLLRKGSFCITIILYMVKSSCDPCKVIWQCLTWTQVRNFILINIGKHYDDVIMTMLATQITSLTVDYSIVYSGVNQ